MPAGGRLSIQTSNVSIDASSASATIELIPGPYVVLAVSDTGTGISAEVRDRIFEPFFTTRKRGAAPASAFPSCTAS